MDWLTNSFYGTAIRSFLDILFLSIIIYWIYHILKRTRAVQLLRGGVFLLLIYVLSLFLHLNTLNWLLQLAAPGIFIALMIIFQPEIREIFLKLGQQSFLKNPSLSSSGLIREVMKAVRELTRQKRGSLIIFTRRNSLGNIIDSGTAIDSLVSASLLLTIFAYDTPLHDGAVIIENGKIASAGCFLPISQQQGLEKSFGTRHRAGIGITEESDALALLTSEEKGTVSLAFDSTLYYDLAPAEVEKYLKIYLEEEKHKEKKTLDSAASL